jgi:hypothetical protein
MKAVRILVWLLAALALAVPPVAVQATPVAWHAASHHSDGQPANGKCGDHGDAKQVVNLCCMTVAPCILATATMSIAPTSPVDRPATASSTLRGLTYAKDPPPPRV